MNGGLRLVDHDSRYMFETAGACQQVRRPVKDRCSLVPVKTCPGLLSVQRGLDGPLELLLPSLLGPCQDQLVIVGAADIAGM